MMRVLKITNVQFFFLVDISLSFLSINENYRKFKKIEKRETYFVHLFFKEDVITTRVSIP